MNMDTKEKAEVELSTQQEAAFTAIQEWLKKFEAGEASRNFFVLMGLAGTGKTFTIKEIVRRLGLRARFMAYTGKAASVMRKYGIPEARTIHSSIYKMVGVDDETFKTMYAARDEFEKDSVEYKTLDAEIKQLQKPTWELNTEAFHGDDRPDILVLDECSMVNESILADLESFGIPIIALGDPGQLPPIDGTGVLFAGLPDASLTEIRRQALDNPIIQWSMWAREDRTLPMSGEWDDSAETRVLRMPRGLADRYMWDIFKAHDICICWKNKTRMSINQWVRRKLGYYALDGVFPQAGERIIFTKNDRDKGVFNGQMAEVKSVMDIYDTSVKLQVLPEEMEKPIEVEVLRACFEVYRDPTAFEALRPWDYKGKQMADFGYAITCHKAQGSQWDRVLVMDENVFVWKAKREERMKWMYTAITRAVERVTIVSGV